MPGPKPNSFVFGGGWDVYGMLSCLSNEHAFAWLDGLLNDRERVTRLGVDVVSMDIARMNGMDIPGSKDGRHCVTGGTGMGVDGLL